MIHFKFRLELSIVPGKVGIWVGVRGQEETVYVKCTPATVKEIERRLMNAYETLASQGGATTATQVRDVATHKFKPVSFFDSSAYPLVYS